MNRAILLPIYPEYANRILTGEKRFEYRSRIPQKAISHIVIYATTPIKKIIGIAEVEEIISGARLHYGKKRNMQPVYLGRDLEDIFLDVPKLMHLKLVQYGIFLKKLHIVLLSVSHKHLHIWMQEYLTLYCKLYVHFLLCSRNWHSWEEFTA